MILCLEQSLKIASITQLTTVEKMQVIEDGLPFQDSYIAILDNDTFNYWLQLLQKSNVFSFNTETDELNILSTNIIGLSFAVVPGKAVYLPVAHEYLYVPEQLTLDYVLAKLKPLLEDAKVLKIGENLQCNISVLIRYGINLRGIAYDTML